MKNSKKGISLIVLIITIIVIIILATAILVSVISNNPISEANKARYESDRDNMQAVFTNTVGKIMAENQGVVNVTAGQINTVTKDAKEATGEVAYTVDNATVAANASGIIKFDKGTNDATTYYTGKKLPIYAAGETKWYVDSEGVLSLEVSGVKYGSGEVEKVNYTSLGNWEHQLSDGTIEFHDTESGICSKCSEKVLVAGFYDGNDNLLADWQTLTNTNKLEEGCPYCGINELSYLIVENDILVQRKDRCFCGNQSLPLSNELYENVEKIIIQYGIVGIEDSSDFVIFNYYKPKEIIMPNTVETINTSDIVRNNEELVSITLSNKLQNVPIFEGCINLTSIIIPNGIDSLGDYCFNGCTGLRNVTIPNTITSIGWWGFQDCTNLIEINYYGTQEEWRNIELGEVWNRGCPEITVHCTDGDIIIPAYEG